MACVRVSVLLYADLCGPGRLAAIETTDYHLHVALANRDTCGVLQHAFHLIPLLSLSQQITPEPTLSPCCSVPFPMDPGAQSQRTAFKKCYAIYQLHSCHRSTSRLHACTTCKRKSEIPKGLPNAINCPASRIR